MRKYLLGVAALALLAVSCKKDKDFHNATIIDSGDITNEGCGYLIRLGDGKEEKPVYLNSNFQHNGMKVKVKFHHSGILDTCGYQAPRKFFELVYVDDIKKDN